MSRLEEDRLRVRPGWSNFTLELLGSREADTRLRTRLCSVDFALVMEFAVVNGESFYGYFQIENALVFKDLVVVLGEQFVVGPQGLVQAGVFDGNGRDV